LKSPRGTGLPPSKPIATRIAARERLTQQHVTNIEALLAAAREHAAGLEEARDLTQAYADNMGRELEKHKLRREQADVLLRTARQQVTAYENALIAADAEIESLKASLAHIAKALEESRTHSDNLAQQIQHLRTVHATELAAREAQTVALQAAHASEVASREAAAAEKLAQTEAVLRSREEKLAKIQSSFSWQITTPLRALRRVLFDRPTPPAQSPALLGNIDYPQDWVSTFPHAQRPRLVAAPQQGAAPRDPRPSG
jgi:chromosome segregation ATPase